MSMDYMIFDHVVVPSNCSRKFIAVPHHILPGGSLVQSGCISRLEGSLSSFKQLLSLLENKIKAADLAANPPGPRVTCGVPSFLGRHLYKCVGLALKHTRLST